MTSTSHAHTTAARRSPGALRLYVRSVVTIGAVVLAYSITRLPSTPHPIEWSLFAAFAFIAGTFTLHVATLEATMSVSDTFVIASTLLFGPMPATVALAADSVVMSWRRGHSWSRLGFNAAAPALSLWVAGQVFFLIAGVPPLSHSDTPAGPLIVPLLCLTVLYFAMNSGFTAIAVGLESGRSPMQVWRDHFLWLLVGYLASASVSFCLILLIQQVGPGAVVVILPVLAVFYLTLRASFGRLEDAQSHVAKVDRLYLSTIETIAMAIDAKDDVTHSHVRRVQAYAVGLASALGIDDPGAIKALEAAALLHDTGKLAVPEHILNKPGKLTESEFEQMKLHVDVGADILSLVEFPFPVVPIVRCHHENWNGTGYPRGVAGEDIPIGARILSVVDCFDALTSDRPYRRAMTEEAALNILRERRGTMYDPRVVDTFVAVYRNIEIKDAETPERRDVLRRIGSRGDAEPRADTPQATAPAASGEVLAFVSLARIAAGDGSVADVLALTSSLIADIAPHATGAWYLPDAGRVRLSVADAFGPAAHVVRGSSVGVGERLTGWVAATRQPMVNADASLDLEALAGPAGLASCMSVPLLTGESLAGVLTLYSPNASAFDETCGRVIQMIAPHIASAIHSASRASAAKDPAPADRPSNPASRDLRLVSTR